MCAATIQSNSETSSGVKAALVQKSNALEIKSIDFFVHTNISVVDNAKSAYATVAKVFSKTKKSLEADAERIGSMGEEFQQVDDLLSKSINELL